MKNNVAILRVSIFLLLVSFSAEVFFLKSDDKDAIAKWAFLMLSFNPSLIKK